MLLYELLTGHTPFDAKELMAQGVDDDAPYDSRKGTGAAFDAVEHDA